MIHSLNAANVAIYTLNPRGHVTPGDASERSPTSGGGFSLDSIDTLKILSSDTGGQSLVGSRNVAGQLERIAAGTSVYYLLGYSPKESSGRSGFRDIKIKVKQRGTRVLTRKGYLKDKQFAEMSRTEKSQQLDQAVLSWVKLSELPLELGTEFSPQPSGDVRLAIELGLERGLLTVSDEDEAELEVSVYLLPEGSKRVKQWSETLELAAADSLRPFRYLTSREVEPGSYHLKVVARDNVGGQIGTQSAYLTIPDLSGGPTVSSLALLEYDAEANVVFGREGGSELARVLTMGETTLVPSPENRFSLTDTLICYVEASNLARDPKTDLPRLATRYEILHGEQRLAWETVEHPVGLNPKEPIPIHMRIPLDDLYEGRFRLEVSILDLVADKGIKAGVDFELIGY